MCRILGIVADEPADFHFCLREAPKSLGFLSHEHPDGWGVAVYDDRKGWAIGKQPLSAFEDPRFVEVAADSHGDLLVAHIRRRTVGPVSIDNTHPFQNGPWVFAHNGTISEIAFLREAVSPSRLAEVRGSTDSEVFFAYLLTTLDALGQGARADDIDAALTAAVVRLASRPDFGAINFLLSDGQSLYAFRHGRTLHLLERTRADEAHSELPSQRAGTLLEASWTPRQPAILVASEEITEEHWREVPEGTMLKVTRRPHPTVTILAER